MTAGFDQGWLVTFAGHSEVQARLHFEMKPPALEVMWTFSNDSATDGDRFSVKVTDPNGAITAQLDATATYQTLVPKRADCPPVCRMATLKQD